MKITQLPSGYHYLEDDCIGRFTSDSGQICHDTFLVPYACRQIPSENAFVIDIGALWGDHSVAYGNKIGEGGTLISIEPCRPAYECLSFNMQAAPCRVLTVHAAVSDVHGGKAYHVINESNVGASMVMEVASKEAEEVRIISIDGLLKDAELENEPVHFIKIDAEGWELSILKGMAKTLEHKPRLLIEINQGRLADHQVTPEDIYAFLKEAGYLYGIIQSNCKPEDPQFDILAWHEDEVRPIFPADLELMPQP